MYETVTEDALDLKRKNPTLDRAIAECLVDLVTERGATVTYRELADSAGEKLRSWDSERSGNMHPLGLRHPLDRTQKYCKDLKLPILSAMVVGKRTGVPGAGFETAYHKWFPKDDHAIAKVVEDNQGGCLKGADWGRLLDFLKG